MDSYLLILTGAFFIGGSFYFLKYFPTYRLIQNTPTSKLRSAAQGFIELYGQLEIGPEGLQISPLTGKACLWWHNKVIDRNNNKATVIYENYSKAPLYFFDGTDRGVINPTGATMIIASKDKWLADTFNPQDRIAYKSLTTLHNTLSKGNSDIANARFSFIEERIEVNDSVYVLGELQTTRPKEQVTALEELQKDIIIEWKENYQELVNRFDKDKDGILNNSEWKLVRLAAQLEAENRQTASTPLPAKNYIICPHNKPFIISTELENKLLATLGWRCKGAILVCGLALVTSLFIIYRNFFL